MKDIYIYINEIKERVDAILPYTIGRFIRKRLNREENGMNREDIPSLINSEKDVIIFDIGAYNGKDTRTFLHLFDDVLVYSFEPDPQCIKKFKRRIKNNKKCKLFEIAISNKDGSADFYLSDRNDMIGETAGASSIKKPTKNFFKAFPQVKFENKIKIKTQKLDTFCKENNIDHIDFIWADVEGAERELIEGGIETLSKKTKYLYTEYSDDNLHENQPNLKEICKMLPMFKVLGIYDGNVLLKNTTFEFI